MRILLIVATFLISSAALAGPKEDALVVLDKWTAAFAAPDVDGIASL
jgi:hypothetical protein